MSIVLDGTAGITTPEIVSTGGPLVVNASAPDNSVVVNASGNVGIGTSSPVARLHVNYTSSDLAPRISGSAFARLDLEDLDQANDSRPFQYLSSDGGSLIFGNANRSGTSTTGSIERMRIDSSGNLLVGTTSNSGNARIAVSGTGTGGAYLLRLASSATGAAAADGLQFIFGDGVEKGSIRWNSTVTAYNTSSDYRLKHDIAPMTGALARVAALKPCTYKWNVDNSADEGFIAHELAEVCPSAVSGEKDAVDAEGNPQYQGIDTSFLVATLTAALQELKAINDAQAQTIESLTARVVALEQA